LANLKNEPIKMMQDIKIDVRDIQMGGDMGKTDSAYYYAGFLRKNYPILLKQTSSYNEKVINFQLSNPHPNIANFLGICDLGLANYTIYERLDTTLDEFLIRNKLTESDIVIVASQIAEGLEFLHKKRVWHRQVSCRNIMFEPGTLHCKITHLGHPIHHFHHGISTKIAHTAPEGFTDSFSDEKIDIYAFGIMLSQLLTGKKPYHDLELFDDFQSQVTNQNLRPTLESVEESEVVIGLKDVCAHCWDKDPSKRPSMSEVYSTLKSIATNAKIDLRDRQFDPSNLEIWTTNPSKMIKLWQSNQWDSVISLFFAGVLLETKKQDDAEIIMSRFENSTDPFILGLVAFHKNDYVNAKQFFAKVDTPTSTFMIGWMYFHENNLDEAKIHFQKSAEDGNCNAQFYLGKVNNSIEWLLKSANQGHSGAQDELTNLYLNKLSDPKEALKWAKISSRQDSKDGNYNLACFLQEGREVIQDLAEAAKLFQRSADNGNTLAQFATGMCLLHGKGVSIDLKKSIKYFRLGAESKHLESIYMVATLERGKSELDAFKNFKIAADLGHAKAQYTVGEYYYSGKYVPVDYKRALEYFHKAETPEALNKIGLCYLFGHGVKMDRSIALEWFEKAEIVGNADAMYNIGKLLISQNLEKSISQFTKAAQLGHVDSMFALGEAYFNGNGIQIDLENGVEYYKAAAEKGHVFAQYAYGMYLKNIKLDPTSYIWLEKSASTNHIDAIYALADFYLTSASAENWKESLILMQKAALRGHAGAQMKLGQFYSEGIGCKPSLDEAEKWYIMAFKNGCTEAGYAVEALRIKNRKRFGPVSIAITVGLTVGLSFAIWKWKSE
jgi:TPR repeat protein/serine/threonine protein kinase